MSEADIALTRLLPYPKEASYTLISRCGLPGNDIPGMTSRNYDRRFAIWGMSELRDSFPLAVSDHVPTGDQSPSPRLVFPSSAQRITFSFCCKHLDALL